MSDTRPFPPTPARARRALSATGLLLGLAAGGFFDGILLHQVLQWHHLLSNVEAVTDLRVQILADGLFHLLMYAVAGVALFRLWRHRSALGAAGSGRALWGRVAIGFGAWHVADAVLSHWITRIHRIRMDSPEPLLWDIGWVLAFGLLPLAIGWFVSRNGHGDGGGSGRVAALSIAFAVTVAGPVAALPANPGGPLVVAFAPGVSPAEAMLALARLNARVLWVDRSGGVWAVSVERPRDAWSLYAHGALLVSRSPLAVGCLGKAVPG